MMFWEAPQGWDESHFSKRYILEERLGDGEFGVVYRAQDTRLEREVALKFFNPRVSKLAKKEDLLDEARKLARLDHPHIMSIYDCDGMKAARTPFYVMAYAAGGSLRALHPRTFAGTPKDYIKQVISYIVDIAAALQFAHDQGVVHCDVKPDNCLLTREGTGKTKVLLSDFGLAITRSPHSIYSQENEVIPIPYCAPEIVREALDYRLGTSPALEQPIRPLARLFSPASDQYALGVVTYKLLTGEFPFADGASLQEKRRVDVLAEMLLARPRSLQQVNPAIKRAIDRVVLKALARDPKERWPSIKVYADELAKAEQETSEEWLEEGNDLARAGRYHEALDAYKRAIELDAGLAAAYSGKARVLNQLGKYKEALAASEEALGKNSQLFEALVSKGYACLHLKQPDSASEAYEAYKAAVVLDSSRAEAHLGMGWSQLALGQGSLKEGRHQTERSQEVVKAFDAAIKAFRRAIEHTAAAVEKQQAYSGIGQAHMALKEFPRALLALNEAQQHGDNSAQTHKYKGDVLLSLGWFDDAEDAYSEAIRLKHDYAEAYLGRGDARRLIAQRGANQQEREGQDGSA